MQNLEKKTYPSDNQIREFWEWCGLIPEKVFEHPQFGHGAYYLKYPELGLNSLFKHAVPKAIETLIEQSRTIAPPLSITEQTAFRELMSLWLAENPMQFGLENTLFWAIQEVIRK